MICILFFFSCGGAVPSSLLDGLGKYWAHDTSQIVFLSWNKTSRTRAIILSPKLGRCLGSIAAPPKYRSICHRIRQGSGLVECRAVGSFICHHFTQCLPSPLRLELYPRQCLRLILHDVGIASVSWTIYTRLFPVQEICDVSLLEVETRANDHVIGADSNAYQEVWPGQDP